MPAKVSLVKFEQNNLKANALKFEGHFDLDRERDVPVQKFLVAPPGGGTVTTVEEGKYKSAMLLLYLSDLAGSDQFVMTDIFRGIVREYYGDDLCADAERNPETTHTTIRDLLREDGEVTIRIWRIIG